MDNPYEAPWNDPLAGGPPPDVVPRLRPISVTVLGILNIIFGSMGMICRPFELLILVMPMMPPGQNPAMDIMQDSQLFKTCTVVLVVLGTIAAGAELAAGIGMLRLKPWGRTVSLGYAVFQLLALAANLAMNYFLLMVPLMEQARRTQDPRLVGAVAGGWLGFAGSFVGVIYPVVLLIFLTRPRVVQAFARAKGPERPDEVF